MLPEFTHRIRQTATEFESLFPLIQLLNPNLTEPAYEALLPGLVQSGFQVVSLETEQKLIAMSGFWIQTKIYCGKYLELDAVVVHPDYRSCGLGQWLVEFLEKRARAENCAYLMLDAYSDNKKAHRFYEREGFKLTGFHFMKKVG